MSYILVIKKTSLDILFYPSFDVCNKIDFYCRERKKKLTRTQELNWTEKI